MNDAAAFVLFCLAAASLLVLPILWTVCDWIDARNDEAYRAAWQKAREERLRQMKEKIEREIMDP